MSDVASSFHDLAIPPAEQMTVPPLRILPRGSLQRSRATAAQMRRQADHISYKSYQMRLSWFAPTSLCSRPTFVSVAQYVEKFIPMRRISSFEAPIHYSPTNRHTVVVRCLALQKLNTFCARSGARKLLLAV